MSTHQHPDQHPDQHHDQHHDSHEVGGHVVHRSLRLDPDLMPAGRVHRLDRRRFLAELGRNTFAVAIVGGLAAACAGDDDASTTGSSSPPATGEPLVGGPARWAQVDLGFVSAYVLVRGNAAAVVDTGTSGSADQIGDTLATLGVSFDDVRHVVLTHSHPDHIGSLPVVLGRAASASAYAGGPDIPNIDASVDITAVVDGDDVFGLEVIETPGHTPGSISVLDGDIGLLIAGDALNGTDDGTAVLGPDEQFTADMGTATASVGKLAAREFEIAAFGHGQPVTSGADELVRALT